MKHILFAILSLFISTAALASNPNWIVHVSGGATTEKEARAIIKSVKYWSKVYHVPEQIVWKVMYVESRFVRTQVSPKNAVGLMQIVPQWHGEKLDDVTKKDLFKVDLNVRVGVRILSEYLERYGSLNKALYAYNGLNGVPGEYAKLVNSVKLPNASFTRILKSVEPLRMVDHKDPVLRGDCATPAKPKRTITAGKKKTDTDQMSAAKHERPGKLDWYEAFKGNIEQVKVDSRSRVAYSLDVINASAAYSNAHRR